MRMIQENGRCRGSKRAVLLNGVLGLGACLAAGMVQAGPMAARASSCQMNVGGHSSAYIPSLFNLYFTPTTTVLKVPQDAPIGTELMRMEVTVPDLGMSRQAVPMGHCPFGAMEFFAMTRGSKVSGMTETYTTEVAGIGYQLTYPGRSEPGNTFFMNTYQDGFLYWPPGAVSTLTLVKTGPVSGGTIKTGLYGKVSVAGNGVNESKVPQLLQLSLRTQISVSIPTCNIASADRAKNVVLAPVGQDRFSGIGSKQGARQFSVMAECQGDSGRPYVSFTATSGSVSGQPGVLALTADSSASGVSVYLSRKSDSNTFVPVSFDDAKVRMGDAAGTSGAYRWLLNMEAGYIQTGSTVTEGSVKAMATLAVTYN